MTDHRDRVRALIARGSLKSAAKQLRMAELTVAKYVAGLPVEEQTELLIDARMREYTLAHGEPSHEPQPAR